MKKLLYTLLAVSLIFSACEKEEENSSNNNSNNNNNSASIEGLWMVTSETLTTPYGSYTNNGDDYFNWFSTIELLNDGKGVATGELAVTDGGLWQDSILWSIDSDSLYLLEDDGDKLLYFGYEINSNNLTLVLDEEEDGNYIRTIYAAKQ
jgi:hypothetical protein